MEIKLNIFKQARVQQVPVDLDGAEYSDLSCYPVVYYIITIKCINKYQLKKIDTISLLYKL